MHGNGIVFYCIIELLLVFSFRRRENQDPWAQLHNKSSIDEDFGGGLGDLDVIYKSAVDFFFSRALIIKILGDEVIQYGVSFWLFQRQDFHTDPLDDLVY